MTTTHCTATVHERDGWHSHKCTAIASTPKGFCKVHDPDLQKAREIARGPTKFQRQCIAGRRADELLDQLAVTHPTEVAEIKRQLWIEKFG